MTVMGYPHTLKNVRKNVDGDNEIIYTDLPCDLVVNDKMDSNNKVSTSDAVVDFYIYVKLHENNFKPGDNITIFDEINREQCFIVDYVDVIDFETRESYLELKTRLA